MKNIVIVICSARHSQFCNFICNSIINAGFFETQNKDYDFVFVLNDAGSLEEFKSKANHNEEVYKDCLSFIEKANKIGSIELNNEYRYEIGALNFILNKRKYDSCEQVFLLQCSYEILDIEMFNILFSKSNEDKILAIKNAFQDYALKIPTKYLKNMIIPVANTKAEAIRYEGDFVNMLRCNYNNLMKSEVLGKIRVSSKEKFGRLNRTEETQYFRKWKGTWNINMIDKAWN